MSMIHLTENIIAIEVPNDATDVKLNNTDYIHKSVLSGYTPRNGTFIKDVSKEASLIGITPLSEEQWGKIVEPIESPCNSCQGCGCTVCMGYGVFFSTVTESGLSLMESKGLSPDKKYAIIKIEK